MTDVWSTRDPAELDTADRAAGPEPAIHWPVAVVQWPEQSSEAESLARDRRLRLFLVAPDAEPPVDWDGLSDWIRRPAKVRDIYARIETLQRRSEQSPPIARAGDVAPSERVELDRNDLLWRGKTWVALAPIEARLLRAFLDRSEAVVSRSDLLAAAWPWGVAPQVLDPSLRRLRCRIAELGLRIVNVRQRGYILKLADG